MSAASSLVAELVPSSDTPSEARILPLRRRGRSSLSNRARPGHEALPDASTLRDQWLFADLSHSQLARIRDTGRVIELEGGQVLYERGQPARHFYLVLDGQMNLALHSRCGEEKIVEIIGSGEVFAEAILFLDEPAYQLTAAAAVPTRVARFDNATYLAVLAETPATCLRMLGHLSRRLHGRIRDIEHLSFEGATHRLVRLLLSRLPQADGPHELRFTESRQELAAFLSMKPETLSRSMRALAESGVLEIDGRVLRVPSRARLAAGLDATP